MHKHTAKRRHVLVAREAERAAIVAWLRKEEFGLCPPVELLADEIERGVHLKEGTKKEKE